MALTVTQPFAGHAVGDVITDADEIKAVLADETARFVVATADEAPASNTPAEETKA